VLKKSTSATATNPKVHLLRITFRNIREITSFFEIELLILQLLTSMMPLLEESFPEEPCTDFIPSKGIAKQGSIGLLRLI